MPTFKVSISRPATPAPIWDWAPTIVARDSATALGFAYEAWVASTPPIPIPLLSVCRTSVFLIRAVRK